MHNKCMPNVQVRDVPDDVHKTLLRRAERAGQSLQQYLSAQLASMAATPTLDEVLDRVDQRQKGTVGGADVAELIRDDRDRR